MISDPFSAFVFDGDVDVDTNADVMCERSITDMLQSFDLDLEGAQTLRILCYKMENQSDILLGKCALEVSNFPE